MALKCIIQLKYVMEAFSLYSGIARCLPPTDGQTGWIPISVMRNSHSDSRSREFVVDFLRCYRKTETCGGEFDWQASISRGRSRGME